MGIEKNKIRISEFEVKIKPIYINHYGSITVQYHADRFQMRTDFRIENIGL